MIKIIEPVLERDFEGAERLVEENLYKHDHLLKILKTSSSGELLVAKNDENVVGMLSMRRPGKIFKEIDDKYFCLEKNKHPKEVTGYIALVSVDQKQQRLGIGKRLVKRAIEIQNEWGARAIIVHASQSSPHDASQKLFSSFGFIPTHLHKKPWYQYSAEKGPDKFWCNFCGNPCNCDELEMILYLN